MATVDYLQALKVPVKAKKVTCKYFIGQRVFHRDRVSVISSIVFSLSGKASYGVNGVLISSKDIEKIIISN